MLLSGPVLRDLSAVPYLGLLPLAQVYKKRFACGGPLKAVFVVPIRLGACKQCLPHKTHPL